MDVTLTVVAAVGGVALALLWVRHLRRDLQRRRARTADFDGETGTGELWTSAARCPECHAGGALLSREADVLWHTCMSCGHRHQRVTRG